MVLNPIAGERYDRSIGQIAGQDNVQKAAIISITQRGGRQPLVLLQGVAKIAIAPGLHTWFPPPRASQTGLARS